MARQNLEFRHHTKAVVSWYKSDLLAGNHELRGVRPPVFLAERANAHARERELPAPVRQRGAVPNRHLEQSRHTEERREIYRPVCAGRLDGRPAADAQSGGPLRPRQRVRAGPMPRGRGLCRGRVLGQGPDEGLELGRAAPACRVQPVRQRPNRAQGRVGTLRSHARGSRED